ncbi:unnamed protein product, partial [marine sediment metagenome]
MDIVVDGSFDTKALMKDLKRREKKMRKNGEFCSHCKKNKATGLSIVTGIRHHETYLIQRVEFHTIPVCKRCSERKDL